MKRTCEEAFTILENLNRKLDCTYPDEELAKKIGFDKNNYSGVVANITSGGYIVFILHAPYENPDEVLINIDDKFLDRYLWYNFINLKTKESLMKIKVTDWGDI